MPRCKTEIDTQLKHPLIHESPDYRDASNDAIPVIRAFRFYNKYWGDTLPRYFFALKCTYNQPAYSFGSAATFLKEGGFISAL